METVTYKLKPVSGKTFYEVLSDFTTFFLDNRSEFAMSDVEGFVSANPGKSRSFDEAYLEYLTLGILMTKYSQNALSSGRLSLAISRTLTKNRNRFKPLKPYIDKVRGIVTTMFLNNRFVSVKIDRASRMRHFLKWLDATGEFSEETIRLERWLNYVAGLTRGKQASLLLNSEAEGRRFEKLAKEHLGAFTENVDDFRRNHLSEHRFRENLLFCGRHEVEYHLNMFGAEILNRAFKPDFSNTSKRVILLPTCMSQPKDGNCKAIQKGSKLVCTACSPECNINIKRWEYSSSNTEVVLIPHSSDFTRYLKFWKNQQTTGLIGVACVLNLLKGGYEMQKLNIPSQCVFLDYCGCKKHWHRTGIPTNLDNDQLQRVVG